jgi:phosphopantetheine adenylyltransferase
VAAQLDEIVVIRLRCHRSIIAKRSVINVIVETLRRAIVYQREMQISSAYASIVNLEI